MRDIKYSIIIPHKNTPVLLNRCIESIPDRKDIEIIIVDDDSDSNIVDFTTIPGLKRNNVNIIFNKDCKGAGHARNLGLSVAKGKWLLFADADDYYSKNFVDIIDNKISDDIDILFFNAYTYNNLLEMHYKKYFMNDINEDSVRLLWYPWNKVFSRELIFSNKILFDEIAVGNDALFCLKANFKAKKILIIEDKLYYYTDDNKLSISLQKKDFNRVINYLDIYLKINALLRQYNKHKYTSVVIAPKTLIHIIRNYGLKNFIKYIIYIKNKKLLFIEILTWLKNKLDR